MAANVETMMYVREKPWHGLGTMVEEAPTSADALRLAGLDWTVDKKNIQVCGGAKIENYKANVRSSDGAVLGMEMGGREMKRTAEYVAYRAPDGTIYLDWNNNLWTFGYPYYPKHKCVEVERGTCEGGPFLPKFQAELQKKYGNG